MMKELWAAMVREARKEKSDPIADGIIYADGRIVVLEAEVRALEDIKACAADYILNHGYSAERDRQRRQTLAALLQDKE